MAGLNKSGSIPKELVEAYRLDEPLDASTEGALGLSGQGTGFRFAIHPEAAAGSQAFGGASRSNHADTLSLFIRAQIAPSDAPASNGHGAAMASLLGRLLDVVRACYDFEPEARPLKVTASKKKKRKAPGAFAPSVLETVGSQKEVRSR